MIKIAQANQILHIDNVAVGALIEGLGRRAHTAGDTHRMRPLEPLSTRHEHPRGSIMQ